jgi:hypothetical protein
MKVFSRFLLAIPFFIAVSCMSDDAPGFRIISYTYDFNAEDHGWTAGFSDLPAGEDDSSFFELKHEYTANPVNLKKSIMLSGNNHSDDLFMYIKTKLTNLDANAQYTLTFEVEFASEALKGSVGAGGSPAESVFLKAGAATLEPKSLIENDWYVLNIDKGDQSQSGTHMIVIGDIGVPEDSNGFAIASRSNSPYNQNSSTRPIVVTTNNDGEAWLIVGTDSGYEGVTTLYYSKISVILSQTR